MKIAVFSHRIAAWRRVSAGLLTATLMVLATAGVGSASDPLPEPQGPVILTIGGSIGRTSDGSKAYFDLAMLESLGTVTIETTTPWTDGVQRFEGVLARDVLAAVEATGDSVLAGALNNYIAALPTADFQKWDVILAFRQNGSLLTARTKGPLFVVYPFDSDPDLHTETIYSRAVWQLRSLDLQ
jgi:hypothetical protein